MGLGFIRQNENQPHRLKLEAAGIEPSDDFDATADGLCDCENCQQCRAANALHGECLKSHLLASFDHDLQFVIAAWERSPETLRKAVATLLGLGA